MPFLIVVQLITRVRLSESMDCSPPGSSVHGILLAGILEWVAIRFCRGSSWPRDQTMVSCTAGKFFTVWATKEWSRSVVSDSATLWTAAYQASLSMGFFRQECWNGLPLLPRGSLPDPGLKPHFLHWQVDSLPLCHLGSHALPPQSPAKCIWLCNLTSKIVLMIPVL